MSSEHTPTADEVREAVEIVEEHLVPDLLNVGNPVGVRMLRILLRSHAAQAQRIAELTERLEFYQGLAKERHDREVLTIARAKKAEADLRRIYGDVRGKCLLCADHPGKGGNGAWCDTCRDEDGKKKYWTPPLAWTEVK